MKNVFKKSLISWVILFALYNLAVFAVPGIVSAEFSFNHTFWILYTIVTAALAVQLVATWFVLQNDRAEQLFLHFPLIRICSRGTTAITVIGIVAMLLPAQMPAIRFIAAFVCLMISGLSAVSVITGISAAELVTQVDAQTAAKTAYIRKITAQARPLMTLAQSDAHRAAAQKVYEALRYSEPAFYEELAQTEEEISVSLEVFSDAVRRQDDAAEKLAADLLAQISQRNALCRELKTADRTSEALSAAAADTGKNQRLAAGLVCLIAAVGCAFTLWLYPRVIVPAQQYREAIHLMETGEYDQAAEAFAQLGQYKDAAELQQETYYRKATNLLLKGDLETARTMFLGLGNYRDSAELILECDFQEAAALFVKGEYQQALAAFQLLPGHPEAQAKIQECRYAIAMQLLEEGNTEDAESWLAQLGSYQDADKLLKELRYSKAKALLHQGLEREAAALFATLDGYKESDTYVDFIPENLPEEPNDRIYIRNITDRAGIPVTQTLILHENNKISLKKTNANGSETFQYRQVQAVWDEATHTLTIHTEQGTVLVSITFMGKLAHVEAKTSAASAYVGYFETED